MSVSPSAQLTDVATTSESLATRNQLTSRTPKSMLKTLFNWRKVSSAPGSNNGRSIDMVISDGVQDPNPVHSTNSTSKPVLFERSRSDTSITQQSKSRSKSRRRSRSRCRAIWDPPPLFQAYTQASMSDTLLIPNRGLLDWLPRNTSSRSSAKNSDTTEEDVDNSALPSIDHRRSLSDSSTSSLSQKLFFLLENGHILQYKVDGLQDRLPERVVELSSESVAFASDAIAGQHYVLEIWPYGRTKDGSVTANPRSAWSRMSLKTNDTKRLADKLLVVFENKDAFYDWLHAVRKQIECLGGLEYQPDAPPLPLLDGKRPALRHTSSEYFKRRNGNLFSRSTSALPLKVDDHVAHEKDLPQLPPAFDYQRSTSVRSTATSSIGTTTSLDRSRESYSGSSTAGTAISSATSAASLSPTKETFCSSNGVSSAKEHKTRTVIDKPVPRAPTSPLQQSFERPSSPDNVVQTLEDLPFESVQTSVKVGYTENNATASVDSQVLVAESRPSNFPSPELTQLPTPELRKRPRQAYSGLSISNAKVDPTYDIQEATARGSEHAKKPSLSSSSRATYGLFPKKLALDVKIEPLVVTEQNHVPGLSRVQATDHLELSSSPITPVASAFGNALLTRSKTNSSRPAPIMLPNLLAIRDIDQPQRSPAVTDLMLNTNFGILPSGAATQPTTPIEVRVPNFSNIQIDQSLIDSVREIESRSCRASYTSEPRNPTPRRSMPNIRHSSSNVPKAPVGPPPSGPLPAVPQSTDGRNSRDSTPSRRTSTQGTVRRASTKSLASTKKIRSPPPSYSMPPARKRASSSSATKTACRSEESSALAHVNSASSLTTTVAASTIGQVSVVSAPPRCPSPARHTRSMSTSSIKSNRSRRAHTRASSTKSITSIPGVPSMPFLISPPCGLEFDSENTNKGCFGMRSTTS